MIPKGWQQKSIGDLVDHKKGFAFKSKDFVRQEGRRVIRVSDTDSSSIKKGDPIYLSELKAKSYPDYELKEGDIVLSTVGSRPPMYESMVGKAITVNSVSNGSLLNQNLVKLTPKANECLSEFLYPHLKSNRFIQHIEANVRGNANQVSITLDDIFRFEIPLPPLAEQKKIAEILSCWDRAIGKCDKVINSYTKLKMAMQNILLNPEKLSSVVSCELKKNKIGDLAKTYAGGTPSTKNSDYWSDGDIPWMSSGEVNMRFVADVKGRITEKGLKESSAKWVPSNSVVMALAGQGKTRGKVALTTTKLTTNQSLAAIVVRDKDIEPLMLFYLLENKYLELRAISEGGGGRGGLNLKLINDFQIDFPEDPKLQSKISNSFFELDQILNNYMNLKTALRKQKEGLMQQLLTGKVRVKV